MAVDIRPLLRALKTLTFTTPLAEGSENYVARRDGLGQQILNRLLVPATRRLLVGGPAGCGKSTELLQIQRMTQNDYVVVTCPCDRDLDLYKLELLTLIRYLMWRILFVSEVSLHVTLTAEIRNEVLACTGSASVTLPNPRMFFSSSASLALHVEPVRLFETFVRLVSEVERTFGPVLLLIDGLEKVPPQRQQATLEELVRHPILDGCNTAIIVPIWVLYGEHSMEFYPDVEVLRVKVDGQSPFIREIVARRAGEVFEPQALEHIAAWSGGLPRDGLQLAWRACRAAMDDGSSPKVMVSHVEEAVSAIQQGWEAMLSDQPDRNLKFLRTIQRSGGLPGEPDLRNLMLGHGIVLASDTATFRVHPIMEMYLERT